jgi:hypothetical protein
MKSVYLFCGSNSLTVAKCSVLRSEGQCVLRALDHSNCGTADLTLQRIKLLMTAFSHLPSIPRYPLTVYSSYISQKNFKRRTLLNTWVLIKPSSNQSKIFNDIHFLKQIRAK